MDCPTCGTETKDIEELAENISDPQELPNLNWCPNCGTVIINKKFIVPEIYRKDNNA